MSVNSTNPSTLFGGTWQKIEGRFLIGVGKNTDDNNETWEITSGQAHGEYNHMLTIDEMPKHMHDMPDYDAGYYAGWGSRNGWCQASVHGNGGRFGTDTSGNNKKHNNMPPYLGVYMWKRTA